MKLANLYLALKARPVFYDIKQSNSGSGIPGEAGDPFPLQVVNCLDIGVRGDQHSRCSKGLTDYLPGFVGCFRSKGGLPHAPSLWLTADGEHDICLSDFRLHDE